MGEVPAGRVGLVGNGDEWQLGSIDDGWAEQLPSLEMFEFVKYGIAASTPEPRVKLVHQHHLHQSTRYPPAQQQTGAYVATLDVQLPPVPTFQGGVQQVVVVFVQNLV